MESFFLAETTKYLYLLFDEHNFMHGDGSEAKLVETTNGPCVIEGWIIYYLKMGKNKIYSKKWKFV